MSARRVVVVGDVATDVLVHVRGSVQVGSDTAADIRLTGGGAGGNVAAWLAAADHGRAALRVELVGRVGDDDAGRVLAEELRRAGVRAALAVDGARPTGTVVVLRHAVASEVERTMLADRGANLALTPADLDAVVLDADVHVHVSGYALLHDGPRAAALAALERAQRAGATTSVDPASEGPLHALGPARFLSWVRGVDLLLPNLAEARLLSGATDAAEAAAVLARGGTATTASARHVGREVVVTCGSRGAVWSDGHRSLSVPAAVHGGARAAVVDVTGAGDAFAAGYLAARFGRDERPEAALAAGARLAALAVAQVGARPLRAAWPGPAAPDQRS